MNTKVYVYRYYAINRITQLPELLYAGLTDNPKRRDKQHSLTSQWYKQHHYKTIKEFPTKQAALKYEGTMIRMEAPKHNIYHNKMKDITLNLNGLGQYAVNGLIAMVGIHLGKVMKTEAKRHFTVRMSNWS